MTCFVVTPDGKVHRAPIEEWGSLPREVVFAGDCKHGLAGEFEYYIVRCGRVIGTNCLRGRPLDESVKLGTMVSDEDLVRLDRIAKSVKLDSKCRGCP